MESPSRLKSVTAGLPNEEADFLQRVGRRVRERGIRGRVGSRRSRTDEGKGESETSEQQGTAHGASDEGGEPTGF